MTRKKEYIILLIIILTASALRLIFSSDTQVTNDSVAYFSLAEKIGEGKLSLENTTRIQEIIQPGYSIIIFIFSLIINNPVFSSLLISFLSGVILIPLVYFLGKKIFNYQVGFIAASLTALGSQTIRFSSIALTESIFTLLFMGAVYAVWKILNDKNKWYLFFILGVFIGLIYYIRIVGLVILLIVFFWLFFYWLLKKISLKKLWLYAGITLIGVGLTTAPYFTYLYQAKGEFVFTGQQNIVATKKNLFSTRELDSKNENYQSNYRLTEDKTDYWINEIEGIDKKKNGSFILTYLQHFFSNLGYNFVFIFINFILYIILIVYALYIHKKKRKLLKLIYLLSWIPFYLALYYIGRPYIRYYFPIIPILFILASAGVFYFLHNRVKKSLQTYILILFFALLLIQQYYLFPPNHFQIFGLFKESENDQIGSYIKERFGENKKIITSLAPIAYYAEGIHYPLPVADRKSLFYFAEYHKIDLILVIDPRDMDLNPDLKEIYNIIENKKLNLVLKGNNFHLYKIKN